MTGIEELERRIAQLETALARTVAEMHRNQHRIEELEQQLAGCHERPRTGR